MHKKLFLAISLALILVGCKDGGNTTLTAPTLSKSTLTGVGQKGPFVEGSSVSLCQLNTSTANCANAKITTSTTGVTGAFKADLNWSGWTQITISGNSFNEYTGENTTTPLTLDAIINKTDNGTTTQTNVNLFTHLITARVKELVKTMSISSAYVQAQTELQTILGLQSKQAESLNLLDGTSTLAADNATLLVFSAAFHAIDGDSTTLKELAEDFANDGDFNDYEDFDDMFYATAEGADSDGDGQVDKPNAFLNKVSAKIAARNNSTPPDGDDVSTTSKFQLKSDNLVAEQWHLSKINIAGAQQCALNEKTCRGEGILVGVLDDGVEIAHEDLKDNIAPKKSRNYNTSDTTQASYYDPTPSGIGDAHGTSIAGIIAAVDQNGLGVRGIAPRAQLAGFNILKTGDTNATTDALGNKNLMVSNNSWGPTDNACIYQSPSELEAEAILFSVIGKQDSSAARNGKGAILLFASGNGGENCNKATGVTDDLKKRIVQDQASMDGGGNNRYVIAVAALGRNEINSKAVYAEPGVNILLAAPAGDYCTTNPPTLVTTDLSGERGYNKTGSANETTNLNYTACMNGTSGATPVVAGVAALMLQANPNLTWRDVRAILAKTASQNDSNNTNNLEAKENWQTNTVSQLKVHRYYGYGMVNAAAAVALAKTWVNLPSEKSLERTSTKVLTPGDNSSTEAVETIAITPADVDFNKLETVQVDVEFNHQRAGDIELVLEHLDANDVVISSEYLVKLNADNTSTAKSFTFMSSQHLYDTPVGKWVLKANDRYTGKTGSVTWKAIKFFGHQSAN